MVQLRKADKGDSWTCSAAEGLGRWRQVDRHWRGHTACGRRRRVDQIHHLTDRTRVQS